MQFNRFVWSLYRDSKDGNAAIARTLSDHFKAIPAFRESAAFTHNMLYCEVANDEAVEGGTSGFEEVNLRELIKEFAAEQSVVDIDAAEKLFTEIANEYVVWTYENQGKTFGRVFGGGNYNPACYANIFSSIDGLSAGLHDAHPEFFVPYFFVRRFDEFEKICHSFDI